MNDTPITRRDLLAKAGTGLGLMGLAALLADEGTLGAAGPPVVGPSANPLAPKRPHFRPRAKRIIHLFMNGGPSQVDTFDPKPALAKYHGTKPPKLETTRAKGGNLMR